MVSRVSWLSNIYYSYAGVYISTWQIACPITAASRMPRTTYVRIFSCFYRTMRVHYIKFQLTPNTFPISESPNI